MGRHNGNTFPFDKIEKPTQEGRHVFSPDKHVLIWLTTDAKNIFEFSQNFPIDNT